MGAFSYHRFTFLLAFIDGWKVYRLVFACTVMTAIEVECLCVLTSKKRHSLRSFSFLTVFFLFACAAINPVNLAFRTTIIEDTHNSLISLTLRGVVFFHDRLEFSSPFLNDLWVHFCLCSWLIFLSRAQCVIVEEEK